MNLFTKGSHHRNLLTQNAYHNGRVLKSTRDKMQIMTLAKQMYPCNTQHFFQKYDDAVQRVYGYLFVDLKPSTANHCRLRKNVLSGEE